MFICNYLNISLIYNSSLSNKGKNSKQSGAKPKSTKGQKG